MEGRVILHVDMDAFYAAVETRDRPGLEGRPVVIGADPRGGRGRGVVSTANYEARRFGIHSAMPISRAWEACPHAVFLRPSFHKYKAASSAVMEVLDEYADELEVVGMDEAYLDITEKVPWRRVASYARSLQAAVRRATGLSCSVGAGPTKSIAKIASDRKKPHGVTVVPPEDAVAFLAPLRVGLIPGCGPKTTRRLNDDQIFSIGELAELGPDALTARYGKHGAWLHSVATAVDTRPVVGRRGPGKSRGNERTFSRDQHDMEKVAHAAQVLLEGLLRREERPFATITIKLRYHDFSTLTRARTLSVPITPDHAEAAQLAHATAEGLLRPLLDGRPVRLVGVRLSGFRARTGQAPLSRYGVTTAAGPEAAPLYARATIT